MAGGRSTRSGKRSDFVTRRVPASTIGRLADDLRRWAHGRLPLRARQRADTEDVVQQAIVEAIPKLEDSDTWSPPKLRSYLKRAIHHRIIDEIRRAELTHSEAPRAIELEESCLQPTQLEAVLESEAQRRFREALRSLPHADRMLIVGRLDLNLSYAKLAMATKRASADAARVATTRALLRLARELGKLES